MIARIAALTVIMLFQLGAATQLSPQSFALNDSNPYVYLKLDHVGPRKPLMDGEPSTGVWIRIVNNCRVPILVPTVGDPSSNGEIKVLDEVVTTGRNAVKITAWKDGVPSEPPPQVKAPTGYADYADDTPGFTEIPPGNSLLFSVPVNHVAGGDWYMRVRFSLSIPGSEHGPYSYADSFTVHLPSGYLR